jgi:hypothetical protein
VGFVLIAGFLLVLLGAGVRRSLDRGARRRTRATVAAATSALLGFCTAAGYDWVWQLPAVALVALLMGVAIVAARGAAPSSGATTLVARSAPPSGATTMAARGAPSRGRSSWTVRGLVAGAAVCAMIAIAIPLGETVAIRSSQADAQAGQLSTALSAADTAQRLEPYAATPRLQRALILERAGALPGASAAIAQATARASQDSSIWLIRARIDAESGREGAAASDYRRAHTLNPLSPTTALGR